MHFLLKFFRQTRWTCSYFQILADKRVAKVTDVVPKEGDECFSETENHDQLLDLTNCCSSFVSDPKKLNISINFYFV